MSKAVGSEAALGQSTALPSPLSRAASTMSQSISSLSTAGAVIPDATLDGFPISLTSCDPVVD